MTNEEAREPVRLIVWDLDETFWTGTLTEGGITYRQDLHDAVITLARRGIVSSICSKNDHGTVRTLLQAHGIWDYFVMPSIDWEPKGPRLVALAEAVRLRPPTILFIDDNPANLAEARAALPGLQVADETCLPTLLDNRLLRGRPDPELTRLAHYRLLGQRVADQAKAARRTPGAGVASNVAFLRESGIRVTIDHDIEAHIDRAIELINRTNQLNFTKQRLPEDQAEARAALRDLLGGFRVQAGLLRVRDRYGDHGYCGFYAVSTGGTARVLTHFCFSCRILNMGVEAWLYQRLGAPRLRVVGEVLSDPVRHATVDWITPTQPEDAGPDGALPPSIAHVFARGGCELNATMHYFSLVARATTGEFDAIRDGRRMVWQHSMFARYAIEGIDAAKRDAMRLLGYRDEDYTSYLAAPQREGLSIWILSFVADAGAKLYRHRATGAMLPMPPPPHMATSPGERPPIVDPAIAEQVAADFELVNDTPEEDFKHNLRLILGQAPPGARVFILLPKDRHLHTDGNMFLNRPRILLNRWTLEVTADHAQAETLPIIDFAPEAERLAPGTHYDRMTYFRIYEHIMRVIGRQEGQGPFPWTP